MKHGKFSLWLSLIITLAFIAGGFFLEGLPLGIRIVYFIVTAIAVSISLWNIVIISNKPPFILVITKWGQREWKKDESGNDVIVYAEEGWYSLWLKGLVYDGIPINVSKKEIDFPTITVTTLDGVDTEIPVGMGYTPDKKNPINFLNLQSDDGRDSFKVFEDIIFNIVDQEIRKWARTVDTWETLRNTTDEAIKRLLEKICDATIEAKEVTRISSGGGKFQILQFGVIFNRLNLGTMKSSGSVYEASLKKKIEEKERGSETYEMDTDTQKAFRLMKAFKKAKEPKTFEYCYKQVMDQKIIREANKQQSFSSFMDTFFNAKNNPKP